MNPTTPQPEGSIRIDDGLDPIAAVVSAPAPASNWAWGMPLSYVHEMAGYWLDLHDRGTRLNGPSDSSAGRHDSPGVTTK